MQPAVVSLFYFYDCKTTKFAPSTIVCGTRWNLLFTESNKCSEKDKVLFNQSIPIYYCVGQISKNHTLFVPRKTDYYILSANLFNRSLCYLTFAMSSFSVLWFQQDTQSFINIHVFDEIFKTWKTGSKNSLIMKITANENDILQTLR